MVADDVQLIRRILSDDDEAFSILVQKYQKSVHALVWRKVNDFHYAEEITQDTFLQAYKKLSTLKNPHQFAGWLYVIANRLCINWLQRHKPAMQSLEDTPMEEIEESAYNHYAAEQREAEGTKYRDEIVQKLLSKLPESERTVVTLYYLGEMTAKEISKFLGVSVNTITSRLRRARERLQKDQEIMVQEVLSSVQLPTNLTKNIMRQVADVKPIPTPVAKPLLPWGAFGIATLLLALLLGATGQYLVRFQRPYSFDAISEPTVEIIDTFIVLDVDSKPDLRNQVGRVTSVDKNTGTGLQASETPPVSDTHGNSLRFSTAQWTQKADMPTARSDFSTCIVDGKIFVIGGSLPLKMDEYGDISLSIVEMYDPETDTWEGKANMPTVRSHASVSVVDGKIYAIGGSKLKKIQVPRGFRTGSEELPTVEMYDPATDTWTKAQSMNHARCSAGISVVNGEIYAVGGIGWPPNYDPSGRYLSSLYLSNVEVFNPKTNQWHERAEMSVPKAAHSTSVIDGKIYVMGGYFQVSLTVFKLCTLSAPKMCL